MGHPRLFTLPDGSTQVCPKNCSKILETAVNSTSHVVPAATRETWPTILGSYWEWVWGEVGDANPGVGYMHRPSSWPFLQFAPHGVRPEAAFCGNIEFPGRHVAKSLHLAQAQFAAEHNGSFSENMEVLLQHCSLM